MYQWMWMWRTWKKQLGGGARTDIK
jgi:hypothetical protein